MSKPFYDTNIFLNHMDLVSSAGFFNISSITLEELEGIKTSRYKSDDVKAASRRAVEWLFKNKDCYEIYLFDEYVEEYIPGHFKNHISNDIQIIATAAYVNEEICHSIFTTDDILAGFIAESIFGLDTLTPAHNLKLDYKGFKEVAPDTNMFARLYECPNENMFDCLINEYLIVKNANGEIVDTFKWAGGQYERLIKRHAKTLGSQMFGDKLKPRDIYQSCAIDSILSNTMTVISGPAGSGKSLISLQTICSLIDKGDYQRVILMFNPTKARGASDMGYYSGNAIEKAMQNSIGNMLITKFGARDGVERMIEDEQLQLVSMADIRGMEVRDNEILYIPEAQNTSVDLLKLCLSRASSGCKIIIEGDFNSQVDSYLFDGEMNGMRRVIDRLKGNSLFGYIELQNVWRSKIAALINTL